MILTKFLIGQCSRGGKGELSASVRLSLELDILDCRHGATKAGIEGFTRSLARMLALEVTETLSQQDFDTEMTSGLHDNLRIEAFRLKDLPPPPKLQLVAYLLSQQGAGVTGSALTVDVGLLPRSSCSTQRSRVERLTVMFPSSLNGGIASTGFRLKYRLWLRHHYGPDTGRSSCSH